MFIIRRRFISITFYFDLCITYSKCVIIFRKNSLNLFILVHILNLDFINT